MARRFGMVLDAALLVAMAAGFGMIFFYAPIESEMGIVQKIFYVHVPLAWNAFLGFAIVFFASFRYLATRDPKWDARALAAAEVGVLFTTLVLITGPIWAKPVWGIWWTWDARLTLTLVLWLIYVGYLMLRRYVDSPERRAVLSAVVGVTGFIDVPLVYFAIRWWRTQHPQPVIAGGEGSGLDPRMASTLWVCVAALTLLFIALYRRRLAIEALRARADALREEADAARAEGARS
ncbi:MAG TPA: cytochrome c biogenesis protein CcsA [Candidatus Krumholzibacteria bacterium]|nr:cytochrome c biogenesis protein CcsA [Candidatus Krumholzibacteria bacterium]